MENDFPYKYQNGVDIKVIEKYKINKIPAYSPKPRYVETKIIKRLAVKLLANKLKNVIIAKVIFLFCLQRKMIFFKCD